MNQKLFQIIDANLNRAREGLRVCEDIARFAIHNKDIAGQLKLIRHSVTRSLIHSKKIALKKLLRSRDIKKDPLKFVDFRKRQGTDITDIFMSNVERVKESLRVLEECCKLIDEGLSRKFRRLRFKTYGVEKKVIKKKGNILSNR